MRMAKVVKHKARLVAKGYTQEYGIDYKDTFAPVMKYKSLRTILALATPTSHVDQLDVKTAFLNAEVKEEVFVEVPEGLNAPPGTVMKLVKALYGIKQAPRAWNQCIDRYLKSMGFRACRKDTCIYVKKTVKGNVMVIGLFVDDILCSYEEIDRFEWQKYKSYLMKEYEMTDLGPVHHILGMRVTRKDNRFIIDQEAYVNEKVTEFMGSEVRKMKTPEETGRVKIDSKSINNVSEYRAIVGSLIYASVSTRPDIAHAVNTASRRMSDPRHDDMVAAKRVLRYLHGTASKGLMYDTAANDGKYVKITAFSDSDWGGSRDDDNRSTTGYCMFVNGNMVQWNTKRQRVVALSSAEAELTALVEVTKEVDWMEMLLTDMGFEVGQPSDIHVDNQAAIRMVNNDIEHDRSKHIRMRYQWVKELVDVDRVNVKWVETKEQLADVFTKALGSVQFDRQCDRIMSTIRE